MRIKLNKYNSEYSVNEEGKVDINLSSNYRIMPQSQLSEIMDLNELYNTERNNSFDYRMIFTINPVCTNVLFNICTEIVRNEGHPFDQQVLIGENKYSPDRFNAINTSVIDRVQAIRDSEYSHESLGNFTYHCGVDIFNNHLLRSDDFLHVNNVSDGDKRYFNTISDYIRDDNGKIITEYLGVDKYDGNKETQLHLYQLDNIKTMSESYNEKLVEVDGWVGFNNPTRISIPIKDDKYINKLLNNRGGCEFIDMYPDRTLYSFIPKNNPYKKRLEYNWDYILMYPYENDYLKFIEVNEDSNTNCLRNLYDENGITCIKIIENTITHTNSGVEMLTLRSLFKHNLKKNDTIKLYYKTSVNNKSIIKPYKSVRVYKIGDINGKYNDTLFSIKLSDISIIINNEKDKDIKDYNFWFRKENNGVECDYYIRKFKEIRSEDGERLKSEINKLAYGENIYGDKLSQIIFTEKVKLGDLRDNLGRGIHEVYLTIIKRNKGRKEWYSGDFNNDTIEYSHCFGKLTSGFDFGNYYDENNNIKSYIDFNVRKLHNINLELLPSEYEVGTMSIYGDFNKIPKALEGNNDDGIILSDEAIELYGDIVEFDIYNYKETILSEVKYRFNTEQRELTSNPNYFDIITDDIIKDDYDFPETINGKVVSGFTVSAVTLNVINGNKFAGNLMPEGYFYKAHNHILLRNIDDNISNVDGYFINYLGKEVEFNTLTISDYNGDYVLYDEIAIKSPIDYGFKKGHSISFYHKKHKKTLWGIISKTNGLEINIIIERGLINEMDLKNNNYLIGLCKDACPKYAIFIPSLKKYIWRDIVLPTNVNVEDGLYNIPFTNGCHYIHENINFFLKRQDPTGEYYMFNPEDALDKSVSSPLKKYRRYGWSNIDFSALEVIENEIDNICF